MAFKNTIKSIGLPLMAAASLASGSAFAQDNNSISYGSDAGAEVVDGCKSAYGNSRVFSNPKGVSFEKPDLKKSYLKCDDDKRPTDDAFNRDLEGKSRVTLDHHIRFPSLEGDTLSNGCYNMNWYKPDETLVGNQTELDKLEPTTSYTVCSLDGTLTPYNKDKSVSLYNKFVRDTNLKENGKFAHTKGWYDYTDSSIRLCDADDSCSSDLDTTNVISSENMSNLDLNNVYFVNLDNGSDKPSKTPFAAVKTEDGNYSVKRGIGFVNGNYEFEDTGVVMSSKALAKSTLDRVNSSRNDQSISRSYDASYLNGNFEKSHGNLDAILEGSEAFVGNVKKRCSKKEEDCRTLEDFAYDLGVSAVRDFNGYMIHQNKMAGVGNLVERNGYATTLRDGNLLLSTVLPFDDRISINSTAGTGYNVVDKLDDKLNPIAESCVDGRKSLNTVSQVREVVNCVYNGINSTLQGGMK
jgi:hypothetical protein